MLISPDFQTPFYENSEILRVLTHVPGGLVHIIDDQSRRPTRPIRQCWTPWADVGEITLSFTFKDGDERLDRPGSFTLLTLLWTGDLFGRGFPNPESRRGLPDYLTSSVPSRRASTGHGSTNSFIRQVVCRC
ncbi:hypothetical protein PGT21_017870 [Puccinia graminis f. sp. tritici]|uniref:Uncharacterized protein n=1 Tax=Puccinia graminis f. sp. tritici TaxID=56615 RepID=A0A5B0PRZ6_PUCGR|nr:hypothetical protein PGT21_017870 [Puccinia graminis f. sp. tritici]